MSAVAAFPLVHLASLAQPAKGSMAGGPFGSDLVSSDYVSSGVPVVRGTNLPKDSKFSLDNCVFVSESKADALHLNCAHPGDLVFTQRGTLGQVGLIPHNTPYSRFLISQSQMKMIVDRSKADPLYIYHYFRLPSTVTYIENHALRAGVPHINLGILRRFEIVCPPLQTQQKIAAVLSAYDDLIANNQRRITLLERMAEGIYREWFVRLRFPGHEQVKIERGVPQGWRAVLFSEVCAFEKGKNPATLFDSPADGALPYLNVETLERTGISYAPVAKNAIVCSDNDVLMLMDGARSGFVFRGQAGIVSSTFALVRTESKFKNIVFEYLKAARDAVVFNNTGSAIPHANKEFINRMTMFLPTDDALVNQFNDQYQFIFRQTQNLAQQNAALTQTRNALLPRLISGKLAVDGLDIRFPPGMIAQLDKKSVMQCPHT